MIEHPDKATKTTQTPITAELHWLVHRTALGGVSAATGDKLPETLAENKFKAVKMSHYGMAVVMARLAGFAEPEPPEGMTHDERIVVLERLIMARLLPEPVPAVEGSIESSDLAGGAKRLADAAKAFCGKPGAVVAKDAELLASKKQAAARALFDRVIALAPNAVGVNLGQSLGRPNDDAELATLAHSFNAVCEGLAASAPIPLAATLESFAEPMRMSPTLDDLAAISNEQLLMLCAARGIEIVPAKIVAPGPITLDGTESASCVSSAS